MAITLKFDRYRNVVRPTFVLANRDGTKLGTIQSSSIHFLDNLNSYSELQFDVYKSDNEEQCPLWDDIKDFKLVWCPEWDVWFEIYVETSEDNATVKHVTGCSVGEAELSQINLYGIEINTETDISRDDYVPTTIYNSKNASASLLHRIMEKAPHYSFSHVDSSIASLQRTFKFDGVSIYDAFQQIAKEVNCIFLISSASESGKPARTIAVYDLDNVGKDTNIFVSADNLGEGITYSSDADSVKNCFKIEGGDDLMTATVVSCNPNGSGYIWYITDEAKADMSAALRTKLNQYDSLYNEYQTSHQTPLNSSLVSSYNSLISKYSAYTSGLSTIPSTITGYSNLMQAYYDTIDFAQILENSLMPSTAIASTTAAKEAAKLTKSNISPVGVLSGLDSYSDSSANNAVLGVAKTFVRSDFQVKVASGSYNSTSNTWSGSFTVTNYSDDSDTATVSVSGVVLSEDYQNYIQQRIYKVVNQKSEDNPDITNIFKMTLANFKVQMRKYCLNSLISFRDAAQACLNVMIEAGLAADVENENYSLLYVPYYEKYNAVLDEIKLRESELATVRGRYDSYGGLISDGMRSLISKANDGIQNTLNFENYVGSDLWKEFSSYRRENLYKNDNFISDGLDNAELFERARELIECAQEEIVKSATLQHTITATLKNLLVMSEFSTLVSNFAVGNWLHLRVDDKVYKLRLISYEIDFDNLENLSVEFSDVMITQNGFDDKQSLLNQAVSMATSYDSVMRQASAGKRAKVDLDDWVGKGLSLTKMKIIDSAQNQNMTVDENGILCREYLPITDDYDLKQLKIINRGIYLTDDGWETSRAGIGDFFYYDPEDGKTKEAYGVIADTLVGQLILAEKVGVYNKDGTIKLDENGLTIISNDNGTKKAVFQIQHRTYEDHDGEEVAVYDTVVGVDDNGNAFFKGDITASSLTINDQRVGVKDYIDRVAQDASTASDAFYENIDDLFDVLDGNVDIYYQANQPASANLNDIWVETDNNDAVYRYDGTAWVPVSNSSLAVALKNAASVYNTVTGVKAIADGKIRTFASNDRPDSSTHGYVNGQALDVGDLWMDTNDDNKLHRWDGTSWVEMRDTGISALIDKVDGNVTVHYNSSAPSNPAKNDIWFNTNTKIAYKYTGTGWTQVSNSSLAYALVSAHDAKSIADGKIMTYAQDDPPTGTTLNHLDTGDIWIDTNDNNKIHRWNGSAWIPLRDGGIAQAVSDASSAKANADSALLMAQQIKNGVQGIYFNNSNVATVSINQTDGVKVIGTDNTYFQVKNDAMGFFKANNTGMLYYDSDKQLMYLDGDIVARSLTIWDGGTESSASDYVNGKINTATSGMQTDIDTAKTNASNAVTTATTANNTANGIKNGTNGIDFDIGSGNNVGHVTISKDVGVKVTGKDNSYFQVTNNKMGFFNSSGLAQLAFTDGNLSVTGQINANSGQIGGTNGWTIGTNAIYSNNASSLENANGIYVGTSGISLGNAIVMKPDGSFVIKGNNSSDDSNDSYVLKVSPETNADDGETTYVLKVGNLQFDDSFVLPMKNGGTGGSNPASVGAIGFHRIDSSVIGTDGMPASVDDALAALESTNGDICVVYSKGQTDASLSINNTYTSSSFQPYQVSGDWSTDNRLTLFGLSSIKYWNTTGLSGEVINDSVDGYYYGRVGVGDTVSGACGCYLPLYNNSPFSGGEVTFAFTYMTSAYAQIVNRKSTERDRFNDYNKRQPINVSLITSDGTIIATTTFKCPVTTFNNTAYWGSVTFNINTSVPAGNYYMAFYSSTPYTLIWVSPYKVALVNGSGSSSVSGLYIRSNNGWESVSGGSGGGSSWVPVDASTTSKGIMKVGSGLSVSDGLVSVAIGSGLSLLDGVITATGGSSVSASAVYTGGTSIGSISVTSGSTTTTTTFRVPDATASRGGIVTIGDNINVSSGTISVSTATESALGVVKVGSNISVSSGTISLSQSNVLAALDTTKVVYDVRLIGNTLYADYKASTSGTKTIADLSSTFMPRSAGIDYPLTGNLQINDSYILLKHTSGSYNGDFAQVEFKDNGGYGSAIISANTSHTVGSDISHYTSLYITDDQSMNAVQIGMVNGTDTRRYNVLHSGLITVLENAPSSASVYKEVKVYYYASTNQFAFVYV